MRDSETATRADAFVPDARRAVLGAIVLAVACALSSACVVRPARLEGYACDEQHACAAGTVCAEGLCLPTCERDADCSAELSCLAGACRDAPGPLDDAGPLPNDAGPLPDDGGPADAGIGLDAGPDGGSPIDAGEPSDAGPGQLCFSDPPFCAPAELVVTVCPVGPCPAGRTAGSLSAAVSMMVDGQVVVFLPGGLSVFNVSIYDGIVTIVGEGDSVVGDLNIYNSAWVRLLRIRSGDPIRLYGNSTLTIEESFVGDEQNCLIGYSDSTLVVKRSVFARCPKGAIATVGATTIENSVFTENGQIGNGSNSSSLGGVRLDGPASGNVFRFNTLYRNHANSAPAADCGDSATRLEHSVFFDNEGENSGTPHVLGCTIAGSMTDFAPPPDAGNLEGDPALMDGGWHLAPGSPAIDQAIEGTLDDDFDGEPRPAGAARDIGADEAG